ncbi:SulP family inorganic anion transporter [Thiohalobacter sp. IOR34]|uniref:SulP family inorganic anion transporter n=1 Tax=Thiohalobacter sp. IOR34 TaxID=3057176 RepID=UPI0025B0A4F4|nr:SulP family inorganic anion transporter [Thiohalobacter sp. IOR34]WJW74812.1 SulP family inorganic anion transporter [Thiohalobacter sp. IOR34]
MAFFNFECSDRGCPKNDILSGLTVALALVPEAVAFAFVAGVEPLVGLYATFMVGLITAAIGGRPGMISGATGALAVVMVSLVAQHGIEYLFATVVLMGLIQILVGLLRLGKFIRMVPHPVMLGFVNGLAIVIFLAQLNSFKIKDADGQLQWLQGEALWSMLGLVALTMAIIHFLPRLTRAIPSSLAAILVVSLIVIGLGMDSRTVGDLASIAGGLPEFHIPMVPLDWETLRIILPYAVILAAIGLIESLLTLSLIDEITDTRGRGNKECIGQGVANTVTGLFGGMGGCAMIGQSMINVNSGGRGRLSGISAALFLLAFILFASGLIEKIPLAALTGVMFMVVIGTFEWSSFRIMGKIPRSDAFVLVLVSAVTVATDLAIAVVVGVIVSALVFAWEHAKHIRVNSYFNDMGGKVYELEGPLFFASVKNFQDLFDPKNDPDDVVVEFQRSRVYDHSAIEAIDTLAERYLNAGKRLHLRHLSPECAKLLKKAGDLVEVNVIEDPRYHIAADQLA